jgi:transcriptional regulator with XRE-family HTH domain
MSVGTRVRELRDRRTLADFANPLGVSGSQISAIENGKSNMSFELAEKICDVYKCTMDWLIRGVGSKDGSVPKVEEPKGDYISISKDELLALYRQANKVQEQENEALKKQLAQTKNIEGVAAGQ